jgi:hypothetical protein
LIIPHHVAYKCGARGLDWNAVDHGLTPLVEIFSEHGSSWDRHDIWPMLGHSMGGITASQSVRQQLISGRHFGFTAGTDTHYGHPGCYGEGLTGILATELTREAVFTALQHRRTIAVTGDRIGLWVQSQGSGPGDILPATAPRQFSVTVDPLEPLDYVEVLKNGVRDRLWSAITCPAARGRSGTKGRHLVRLEWGWGRLGAADETDWHIKLTLENGAICQVFPCFASGPGSTKKIDNYSVVSEGSVEIASFTSRRNALPVSSVVLELDCHPSARIRCQAEATIEGQRGGCEVDGTLRELRSDDVWGQVLERFSSPRIRLGKAWAKSELTFSADYEDPKPGPRDTYVFRARQCNGHTAWASPFLFTRLE